MNDSCCAAQRIALKLRATCARAQGNWYCQRATAGEGTADSPKGRPASFKRMLGRRPSPAGESLRADQGCNARDNAK